MFEVVHGSPQTVWVPIVDTDIIYVGSLVSLDYSATSLGGEGMQPMPAAAGASNTTNKDIPYGVCIGTNLETPTFSTTYKTEYVTDTTPVASVVRYHSVEGPWAKGDPQAMAKVALIDPSSIIKGSIFNAATGTAPTAAVVASGASTLGCTASASQAASIDGLTTIYFRTGAARGAYRVTDDASSTVHTWDKGTKITCAVADEIVTVNMRPNGTSRMQTGGEATYIDCGENFLTDYFLVDVIRLDLRTAGQEYCEFRFSAENFNPVRT